MTSLRNFWRIFGKGKQNLNEYVNAYLNPQTPPHKNHLTPPHPYPKIPKPFKHFISMSSKHSYAWGSQYEGLLTHPLVPHVDLRVMGFEARVDLYVEGLGGFGVLLEDLEEALTAETIEQVCTAEIVTVSVHRVWPGYTGFPLSSVMLDLEASREGVRERALAAARFVISEAERIGGEPTDDRPVVGGFLQGSSLFAWALPSASVVEVSSAVQDMVDRHPAVTRVALTLRPGQVGVARVEVPLGSDRRVSEWVSARLRRMRSEYEMVIGDYIKE